MTRDNQLHVRLSDEEMALLSAVASKLYRTKSATIRDLVSGVARELDIEVEGQEHRQGGDHEC